MNNTENSTTQLWILEKKRKKFRPLWLQGLLARNACIISSFTISDIRSFNARSNLRSLFVWVWWKSKMEGKSKLFTLRTPGQRKNISYVEEIVLNSMKLSWYRFLSSSLPTGEVSSFIWLLGELDSLTWSCSFRDQSYRLGDERHSKMVMWRE